MVTTNVQEQEYFLREKTKVKVLLINMVGILVISRISNFVFLSPTSNHGCTMFYNASMSNCFSFTFQKLYKFLNTLRICKY